MKTLVLTNEDNRSVYSFADDDVFTIEADRAFLGSEETPTRIYPDINTSNAVLYSDVTLPEDWEPNRYNFDGTTWTESDGWADIVAWREEIEALGNV